jgi:hypothetical protein
MIKIPTIRHEFLSFNPVKQLFKRNQVIELFEEIFCTNN